MTTHPDTAQSADEAIKALHAEAARLLERKNSDETVIAILVAKGVERHYAEMIIDNVRTDKDHKKVFYKLLIRGGFIFLAGFVMTTWGYLFTPPGGMYFIFWGVMVYGLTDLIRAFILFRKGR
jgi:hypothetical protein